MRSTKKGKNMKKFIQSVVAVAVVGMLFGCEAKILSIIPAQTVLPHPGPLPLGEGELSTDGLKRRTTKLVHGNDTANEQSHRHHRYY